MRTLNEVVARPSAFDSLSNYVGTSDFPGMDCLLTQNRDSDCLTRSNFRSALKALGGESDNVRVLRFNHWACGYWEALAVRRDTPEHEKACKIEDKLEDYPIVNEEDLSDLEYQEASEVWANCYSLKERITYIREHRRQFEFRDFADMMACVRGRYFAGYACELIN